MTIGNTLAGTMLGPYQIQSLLGRGGMSIVYRALDTNLQRQVAIKVLADTVAERPGFMARFRQEALLLAGLQHPHIVQIYDFGEQNGVAYMVQELLAGPTLEQRLAELKRRDAQLSRDEILSIARQVAGALDAAHAAGIIHRDVKPSNIIWNAAGSLVLADFGVAKALQEERLTQTGTILGTPTYLSPEQAQGQPLTPSSDLYSLGVVLYELIAGRPPFEGGTSMAVALSHVQMHPPALRRWRAELPRSAESVVLRALAKQPAARFQSTGDLVDALERSWPAVRQAYTSGTLAPPVWHAVGKLRSVHLHAAPRKLTVLSVLLALIIAAGGWTALRQPTNSAAAPGLVFPTFGAFDPTITPAPDFLATPTAAAAPVAGEVTPPTPMVGQVPAAPPPAATEVAAPAAPVAAPVAAALPSGGAHLPSNPPKPAPPKLPEPDNAKPPKPDKPKPAKQKSANPKPDKPKDHGKGGGKGK